MLAGGVRAARDVRRSSIPQFHSRDREPREHRSTVSTSGQKHKPRSRAAPAPMRPAGPTSKHQAGVQAPGSRNNGLSTGLKRRAPRGSPRRRRIAQTCPTVGQVSRTTAEREPPLRPGSGKPVRQSDRDGGALLSASFVRLCREDLSDNQLGHEDHGRWGRPVRPGPWEPVGQSEVGSVSTTTARAASPRGQRKSCPTIRPLLRTTADGGRPFAADRGNLSDNRTGWENHG